MRLEHIDIGQICERRFVRNDSREADLMRAVKQPKTERVGDRPFDRFFGYAGRPVAGGQIAVDRIKVQAIFCGRDRVFAPAQERAHLNPPPPNPSLSRPSLESLAPQVLRRHVERRANWTTGLPAAEIQWCSPALSARAAAPRTDECRFWSTRRPWQCSRRERSPPALHVSP